MHPLLCPILACYQIDDAVIDRIIADADFDGDGAISKEEFAQAMQVGTVHYGVEVGWK